jgi:UDP-glucuronate 4-epimerase
LKVLVTGNAGFIGFHTAERLLQRGDSVVGIDVVNDYYDPALKLARLKVLEETALRSGSEYEFIRANIADPSTVRDCFERHGFDRVIHLAAQAGVRYSLVNPVAYVESNILGFTNILESCRHASTPHLTYASTSSVYGAHTTMPFRETTEVGHPVQFYAATKRANELMAHSYSHLFRLPTTGLRFFTVYGPWGRPDMAYYQFAKAIFAGTPIKVFSGGKHTRDFTYIDDIVEGVIRVSDDVAQPNPSWNSDTPDPSTSNAPFRIFNIGNSSPVSLGAFIEAIEDAIGKKAVKEMLPPQPGDVPDTFADVSALVRQVGYQPMTQVRDGVSRFVAWYRDYYGV